MIKGDYALALKNLNIALEIEKTHDFNSGIIFLYYTNGETHSKAGNFQLANSFFNKSLQLIENTGELREKPYFYSLLSEHYAPSGNYLEAFLYAKKHNLLYDSLLNISNFYRIEEIRIKNDLEKTVEENQKLQSENMINKHELSLSKKIIDLQLFVIILIGLGFCSLVIFAIYMIKIGVI
jgi:tetratricopeptide (TPR) repeat protein